MNRIVFFVFAILSWNCFAQDYCKYRPKYKLSSDEYGVLLIAHVTTLSAPVSIMPKSNGSKLNSGTGFYLKKRILRDEFLKIEFCLIQKGCYYYYFSKELLRLNYFEIPLLWSHSYSINKKTFHIEGGLAFSYLIFSSKQIETYAEQSSDSGAEKFKEYDIPLIFEWIAPLNPGGNNNLEIGIKFSYSPFSIHEIYQTESMAMFKDDGIHHITYGFQLIYKIK